MGDHTAMAPATNEEVRQLSASISRNIQALATTVESAFSKAANRQDILQPIINEVLTVGGTNTAGLGYEHSGLNQLAFQPAVGLPQSNEGCDSQMTTISHQFNMSDSTSQPSRSCHRRASLAPPIADVSIPSLGCAPGAWRRALIPLKQWIEVDPHTGLALKDWPAKWYKGLMKDKTASLRSQRQVIFEEYER
jgi:hypothetical protein